jgi:hypothetical protein
MSSNIRLEQVVRLCQVMSGNVRLAQDLSG